MTDLIDRQAAIDAVNTWFELYVANRTTANAVSIQDMLRALPSAQPDQPPYVAEIGSEYRKAVNMPYIKKPLAKALYEVWKKHDREDVSRNG